MSPRPTAGVEEGFGAVRPIVWKAHGNGSLFVIPIQVEAASFGRHPCIDVPPAVPMRA